MSVHEMAEKISQNGPFMDAVDLHSSKYGVYKNGQDLDTWRKSADLNKGNTSTVQPFGRIR